MVGVLCICWAYACLAVGKIADERATPEDRAISLVGLVGAIAFGIKYTLFL